MDVCCQVLQALSSLFAETPLPPSVELSDPDLTEVHKNKNLQNDNPSRPKCPQGCGAIFKRFYQGLLSDTNC